MMEALVVLRFHIVRGVEWRFPNQKGNYGSKLWINLAMRIR